MWSDNSITQDFFSKLKTYQKINHFTGMHGISRKNNLSKNLTKMKKKFPKYYDFFPDTWLLPLDYYDFRMQMTKNKENKTYIVKPEASSQGRGIFLIQSYQEKLLKENLVVQQ